MKPLKTTLAVDAQLGRMNELCAFLSNALRDCGVPEKYIPIMELAADEIFSNIVKYAYGDVPPKSAGDAVVVELSAGDGLLELRFEDRGAPFNPLTAAPPDLVSGAERGIGGLGIFIVRSVMDEVRYSREGGRNVLTLVKFVERA
jgi:anti-sigma regulatory factor (Ser/Thr protein kinase)